MTKVEKPFKLVEKNEHKRHFPYPNKHLKTIQPLDRTETINFNLTKLPICTYQTSASFYSHIRTYEKNSFSKRYRRHTKEGESHS